MNFRILFILTLYILLAGCKPGSRSNVHTPVNQSLYGTILQQDSLLFPAFNRQDTAGFEQFFTKDLEVYQDNIGFRNYNRPWRRGLFSG